MNILKINDRKVKKQWPHHLSHYLSLIYSTVQRCRICRDMLLVILFYNHSFVDLQLCFYCPVVWLSFSQTLVLREVVSYTTSEYFAIKSSWSTQQLQGVQDVWLHHISKSTPACLTSSMRCLLFGFHQMWWCARWSCFRWMRLSPGKPSKQWYGSSVCLYNQIMSALLTGIVFNIIFPKSGNLDIKGPEYCGHIICRLQPKQ